MKDFRQLSTWQKSHQLALVLYERTRSFPREEMYGLTGQIRRAATSIPANLAEGCGRDGMRNSLAHDLKLLQSEDYMQLTGG
ncbi:MAG: four helix bundle protein [Chromatiales bacterium]